MVCSYNIALIVVPAVVGYIHDMTKDDGKFGYYWVGIFYLFLMLLSAAVLTILKIVSEKKFNGILGCNKSFKSAQIV